MMDPLKKHVLSLLEGCDAHADFSASVRKLPPERRGVKPPEAPHTAWQLLEHLRIAQSDILEFSRDPHHVSPPWPQGYWPIEEAPPTETAWGESVAAFERDAELLRKLVAADETDLLAPLPHDRDKTLLREVLLAADHNSYHLGQLILLRKLLGNW